VDICARPGLRRRRRERLDHGHPGVPVRAGATPGLIGGPLICATGIAVVLGWIEHSSPVLGIATIPEFSWELSLGIYLTVKGFKPSPILS
jgi:hypothetical protein